VSHLSQNDWAFIKESLRWTVIRFEEYTRYPDYEYKRGRIAEAKAVLDKVMDESRRAKKEARA